MPQYPARAGGDDRIHRVDAETDALIDPSPYRTRCGRPVLEVYNTWLRITCPDCAEPDDRGGTGAP